MRIHRFYLQAELLDNELTVKDDRLLWQWRKVLRLKIGSEVIMFDQKGNESIYSIVDLAKNSAKLKLKEKLSAKSARRQIWLFWALLKKDNNDLILQKCTELGVSNFVPIASARSIRKDYNIERAKKIVIEASEQCGRADVPSLSEPVNMDLAITEHKDRMDIFYCDEQGEAELDGLVNSHKDTGLVVGPEGGFNQEEKDFLVSNNAKPVSLSPNNFTLRAETAAIIAIAKLS